VAEAIAALQADLYVIHTPHGISLSDAYAVYGNTNAAGTAVWMGHWSEFQVQSSCFAVNIAIVLPWTLFTTIRYLYICLQCFDAVGWAAGRASGL